MNTRVSLAIFILLLGFFSVAVFSPKINNSITGQDVLTRVEIVGISPINCSFNMTAGWNYVSFHCIASGVPRNEVLLSVNDSVEKIFTYSSFDTLDPWKSYNPDLPNWTVQQVEYMNRAYGYMILMNNDSTYFYEGYERSSIIQLRPGWNLVGYPDSVNASINTSLQALLYHTVLTYDDGALLVYIPNATNNTLNNFEPYMAYWINSSATQNWMVG